MASKKKYSYYLRGNQLALIEEDTGLGSGTCSLSDYKNKAACENAGGTWTAASTSGADMGQYKSPQESITDGLEIEYAYSPRYSLSQSGQVIDVNKLYVNGWTVLHVAGPDGNKRGYLSFLRGREAGALWNWDAGVAADVDDNEYIVVYGSDRWDGLHQVQAVSSDSANTNGILVTKTEVHGKSGLASFAANTGATGGGQIDFAIDETIFDGGSSLYLADYFSAGDYIWIAGSGEARNNGLFSISSVTQSDTAASSKLTLGTRYSVVNSASSVTASTVNLSFSN